MSQSTSASEGRPRSVKQRGADGPQRGGSIRLYLRRTRVLAFLAVAALVGAVISDFTDSSFWAEHALFTSIVASVLVVLLSVAVVNEVIEQRRRKRWRVLAQYVMFELVRNARMFWLGVLEEAGVLPHIDTQSEFMDAAGQIVRDTAQLTSAVRAMISDTNSYGRLHRDIAYFAEQSDKVIGQWAGVMLNTELYAEIIDRHVELASIIVWISDLLDKKLPPDDLVRRWRARSSPAVQVEYVPGVEWITDRIVNTAQLAEVLDRGTLQLAMSLVSVEWWESRLATASPPPDWSDAAGTAVQ